LACGDADLRSFNLGLAERSSYRRGLADRRGDDADESLNPSAETRVGVGVDLRAGFGGTGGARLGPDTSVGCSSWDGVGGWIAILRLGFFRVMGVGGTCFVTISSAYDRHVRAVMKSDGIDGGLDVTTV
jgi:hypothetical protein